MNIFVLDYDISKNVQFYVDSHVRKMVIETAQMIETNLWIDSIFDYSMPRKLNKKERDLLKETRLSIPNLFPYKPCHENHPCTIWARSSYNNYKYMLELFYVLLGEYKYRFGKENNTKRILLDDIEMFNPPRIGLTEFALAIPDECKVGDSVDSYRNYYVREKSHLFTWTKRGKPYWVK